MTLILVTLVWIADGSFSSCPDPEAAFSNTGSFMKTREEKQEKHITQHLEHITQHLESDFFLYFIISCTVTIV